LFIIIYLITTNYNRATYSSVFFKHYSLCLSVIYSVLLTYCCWAMAYRCCRKVFCCAQCCCILKYHITKTKTHHRAVQAEVSRTRRWQYTLIIIIVDQRNDYVRHIIVFFDDFQFHRRRICLVSVLLLYFNVFSFSRYTLDFKLIQFISYDSLKAWDWPTGLLVGWSSYIITLDRCTWIKSYLMMVNCLSTLFVLVLAAL